MQRSVTILFDLDGTLIDSTEAILESFSFAFGSHGFTVAHEKDIKKLIGYPLDMMFESLGVESECVDSYVKAYKEHYRKISCEKTKLLPGAREAVERAREFARLGIVTTKTALYSKRLLEYMGLMQQFDVLIGREDVVNPKPHPEPIYKALEAMNSTTKECWMIGDTTLDIDAAKAAGVKPFALLCGFGNEADFVSACENIAEDAKSAVEKIGKLYLQKPPFY